MTETIKRYNPNRSADWNYGGRHWKLSRSKIELFMECPRCFYLDNKLGTARPRGPAFTLNLAVDELFKREFDSYRVKQESHPLMLRYGLDAIPFAHEELNTWRDNFSGVTHTHKPTGFTVSGAVDDVWVRPSGELIVVDYKATAKEDRIDTLEDSGWEVSYRRQMGVYQWLLSQRGFRVDVTGYFVYANAKKDAPSFRDTLTFETTLVSCAGEMDWIEETLLNISNCLRSETAPSAGAGCEFCAYREASGKKLQFLHYESKRQTKSGL
jgi:CRISPR/Cas system-associated exonuclease Cas4 (RecB family)